MTTVCGASWRSNLRLQVVGCELRAAFQPTRSSVPYNADNYALLQSLAPPHRYQGFSSTMEFSTDGDQSSFLGRRLGPRYLWNNVYTYLFVLTAFRNN